MIMLIKRLHFNFYHFTVHFDIYELHTGDRASTLVKVLCYKSEGRWFDPSWCQSILPIAL